MNGNLKTLWGKRLPITDPETATKCQILERAVAEWAAFDRNFDIMQECVFFYEDGSSALLMP